MRTSMSDRLARLRRHPRHLAAVALAPALALILAACGNAAGAASDVAGADGNPAAIRVGYFGNVTHAPALVGIGDGHFEDALGDIDLELLAFNAGPSAIEALNAGALDATFIGPSPTINAYVRSGGQSVRIIAGVTSGGAQFVVRDGIETVEDLQGATIATPQLGNTQDVAVRWWLHSQGIDFNPGGSGAFVTPTANAETLTLFRDGHLDGAWVPEPWASRLVIEAGANVFLDERSLWEDGQFIVGHLIVRTAFLEQHPEAVERLLRGLIAAQDAIAADPEGSFTTINYQIAAAAGAVLDDEVLRRSFDYLDFTLDPVALSVAAGQQHSVAVGQGQDAPLDGIHDLRILNSILTELGRPTVSAHGLGQD